jgi:hypothetical protein
MEKLDIDRFSIIAVDFDDTLCIHSSYVRDELTDGGMDYIDKHLQDTEQYPESICKVNNQMKLYLNTAEILNKDIGLISATYTAIQAANKLKWVEKNYGIQMENWCVGRGSNKIPMLEALMRAKGCQRSQILFIDDMREYLLEAQQHGFVAATPMEIVNYVNTI